MEANAIEELAIEPKVTGFFAGVCKEEESICLKCFHNPNNGGKCTGNVSHEGLLRPYTRAFPKGIKVNKCGSFEAGA